MSGTRFWERRKIRVTASLCTCAVEGPLSADETSRAGVRRLALAAPARLEAALGVTDITRKALTLLPATA